ncbi:MAG: YkvA family protein [Anaerolineaceae bacterium]|nr:YkvA family protein [Anaerolineaceae bacterium]
MDLKARAESLKRDVPAVFMALKHPQTPWYAKLSGLLTLCYALSPVDLIPDFIPVIGYLDDLIILPALVALTIHWIPPQVLSLCRSQSEELWQHGKPKKWLYAIPFFLIWLLLIFLLARFIFRHFLAIGRLQPSL